MINKQKHRTTCGIVAVKNALEFKGKRVPYEKLIRYAQRNLKFVHESGRGMCPNKLRQLLKRHKLRYKNIKHPSFEDIGNQLKRGRGVILNYRYPTGDGDSNGHFIFIDRETKRFFRAWNSGNDSDMLIKTKLAKDLRYSHRHHRNRYSSAISII